MVHNCKKFYSVSKMPFLATFMSKVSLNLKSFLSRAVIWRISWLQSLISEVLLVVVFAKSNTHNLAITNKCKLLLSSVSRRSKMPKSLSSFLIITASLLSNIKYDRNL